MRELRNSRERVHVNDKQMRRTDESQMMMSRQSRTSQSHKRSRTKYADVMSKNGMTKRRLGHSRATQVRMEYLRLVNLTEICPSRRVGHFKAPC